MHITKVVWNAAWWWVKCLVSPVKRNRVPRRRQGHGNRYFPSVLTIVIQLPCSYTNLDNFLLNISILVCYVRIILYSSIYMYLVYWIYIYVGVYSDRPIYP